MERKQSLRKKAAKQHGKEVRESEEPLTYQEIHRIPNIHMLKKPAWATGQKPEKKESWLKTLEEKSRHIWRSAFSLPMLFFLALPFLLVLLLTLSYYGVVSIPISPLFGGLVIKTAPYGIAAIWAVALIAFVPWSIAVCSVESWISGNFE